MIITLRDYAGNEIDLDWTAGRLPIYLLRDEKLFALQPGGGSSYWQVHIDLVTGHDPLAIRWADAPDDVPADAPAFYLTPSDANEPVDIDA